MGVWGARAKPRTSNWKEARTVLESLLQEKDTGRLQGRMVFYMTDNLVSYYIINQGSSRSPGLQQLVSEIKELCLQLEWHLPTGSGPCPRYPHDSARDQWAKPRPVDGT
jgi:hypothetical protein